METSPSEKMLSSLQPFLERRIRRLGSRITRLNTLDRRFGLARMIVFFVGLAVVGLAWFLLGPSDDRLVIVIAAGSVVIFLSIVYLHRRLENWIARYKIWLALTEEQVARLTLDWARLPTSQPYNPQSSLDLDLDLTGPRSLHQLLDLAVSQEGSLRLAGWLSHPDPNISHITSRQAVVKELAPMRRFRMRLLLNLRLVSKEQLNGAGLLEWFRIEFPAGRLKWLLLVGTLFTMTNLVLFILNIAGMIPAYWIFSFAAYLGFYYFTARGLTESLEAVVTLDHELDKFGALLRYLESYPLSRQPNLAHLLAPFRDPQNMPSHILRRVKWTTAGVGIRSNPIIHILLNIFLPWDYVFAFLTARIQGRLAGLLPAWLETWTELESLISLGGFAGLNPGYCFPQVTPQPGPIFQAKDLSHPLIPSGRRVGNDFTISGLGEVLVITGSNMAGKSTFLKTVGANLCLAYAGAPVCAASLIVRPLRLHTCMRISDSIVDGFSYFYAEVKCLRSLLDELRATVVIDSAEPLPLLYLIDEIFRGTNNRERLIGSRAYIQALIGAPGAGLIATHDLELAHLAEADGRVSNFHFRDEVRDGRLTFDFIIRPGPSPTTNALKIMELEGLPVEGDIKT